MRALVIAPHPDDEVIGCGGTIAKYILKGDEVHLCVVTKTYPPEWSEAETRERKREALRASAILGMAGAYFLDFPTVKLNTVSHKELVDAINGVIATVQPDVVYIPHGSHHSDHQITFDVAMASMKLNHLVVKILAYEDWGIEGFVPNLYVDISETLETKLKALSEYRLELKEFPHRRSLEAISTLAKMRGIDVGVRAAEAFILVRQLE